MSTALTISHDHASGTLLHGTSRGDGTAEVLKRNRWRWSRNIGCWYVPQSRDRRAATDLINRTKDELDAAGFAVEVEIDDTYRDTAEVEADRADRQEARVEALAAKAERKAGAADAAWEAERRAVEALPPGGEPIHVGHHSERRHRNAIERSHTAARKAIVASDEAQAVERRAQAAAHTTTRRYNPAVIRRRLDKLEADRRRFERQRDGYTRTVGTVGDVKLIDTFEAATGDYRERLDAEIAHLTVDIDYWRGELAKMAEEGAQLWDRATVQAADQVYFLGSWYPVRRVNAKSVTIPSMVGGSWTDTIGYDQIKAVRTSDGRKVRIVAGDRVVDDLDEVHAISPGGQGD